MENVSLQVFENTMTIYFEIQEVFVAWNPFLCEVPKYINHTTSV